MNSGIDETLPLPPCSWAILAASAAAAAPGMPWPVRDVVTADRNCVTRIVVRMAKPRLAP